MRTALLMAGAGQALLLKKSGNISGKSERENHKRTLTREEQNLHKLLKQENEGSGWECASEIVKNKGICPPPPVDAPPVEESENTMDKLIEYMKNHETSGKITHKEACEKEEQACEGMTGDEPLQVPAKEPQAPEDDGVDPADQENHDGDNAFLQKEEVTLTCGPYHNVPVGEKTVKDFLDAEKDMCHGNDEMMAFHCFEEVFNAICEAEPQNDEEKTLTSEDAEGQAAEGTEDQGFLQRAAEDEGHDAQPEPTNGSAFKKFLKEANKIDAGKCETIDKTEKCAYYHGGNHEGKHSDVYVATQDENGAPLTVQCKGQKFAISKKTEIGSFMKTFESDCGMRTSKKQEGSSSSR